MVAQRPPWFVACIVGAVFALILLPAATGFGIFLLNLIAIGCFVAPVVAHLREGGGDGRASRTF